MPTEQELEYIREQHFYSTVEEMADELGVGTSTISRWKKDHLDLPRANEKNRIEYEWGVPICEVLETLHYERGMTTPEMADELDTIRQSIGEWFQECDGVHKRSQAEANRLRYEGMDKDARKELTEAAREANQDKYGDGGSIGHWVASNPEKHREIAQEAAALGAPAREENGMKGRTGQDCPNWRGGKSVYDAVKKQLHGPSWQTIRSNHTAAECYKCGASEDLHLHHIVPLLAGGTNEAWNRMTLCRSCHKEVESYTRDIVAPVLVE